MKNEFCHSFFKLATTLLKSCMHRRPVGRTMLPETVGEAHNTFSELLKDTNLCGIFVRQKPKEGTELGISRVDAICCEMFP